MVSNPKCSCPEGQIRVGSLENMLREQYICVNLLFEWIKKLAFGVELIQHPKTVSCAYILFSCLAAEIYTLCLFPAFKTEVHSEMIMF